MPRTTSRVNENVQIRATAAAKQARVEEAGLGGPRVGRVSARTRNAQARRDAMADAVITPAETAKRKSAAGPGASSNVAAKKPTADAKARQRRTSPLIEVRT